MTRLWSNHRAILLVRRPPPFKYNLQVLCCLKRHFLLEVSIYLELELCRSLLQHYKVLQHLETPTRIIIQFPKCEEVSEQRRPPGSGVFIYLELKFWKYLLANYKVLYQLKKPPANSNKDQYCVIKVQGGFGAEKTSWIRSLDIPGAETSEISSR